MKLICTLENFKKAILETERVVGKQITLPILENILLETEKGMLKISATNLEIGVFTRIGAKIEKDGKITIPAKLLSNFIGSLSGDGNITLTLIGQTLELKNGLNTARIKGIESTDFPIIPEMKSSILFSWPAQSLKEVLPKILVSASVDNTRPELSGVNVTLEKNESQLASTDSFRLTESKIKLIPENQEEYEILIQRIASIIIPANTFAEIWRVIGTTTELVRVAIEENQIFFQVDSTRIVSRLINGKYPEYKQIIPQKFETTVFVEKDQFLRGVKVASFFTQNKGGEVLLRINTGEKKMEIVAQSEDKGENKTEIPVLGGGTSQEVFFNPRYIIDGANAINTRLVGLLLNNNTSPAAIRPVREADEECFIQDDLTYVIMPIRK